MTRNDALLTASLLALVCAGTVTLGLLWNSWEDRQALERRNRELQASLEASRIRLENFCEYPTGALCDVDTPQGRLSDIMDTALPEPGPVSAPVHAIPETSSPSASGLPSPLPETAPGEGQAAPVPSGNTLESSAMAAVSQSPVAAQHTKTETSSPVSAQAPAPESAQAAVPSEAAATPRSASSAEPAPAAQPQTSLTDILKERQETLPPGPTKRTWTNVRQTNDRFTLTIAGEGRTLNASGELLETPPRYVVVLDGLWRLKEPAVKNNTILALQKTFTQDRTLLTFFLKRVPEAASLTRQDERTLTIDIR